MKKLILVSILTIFSFASENQIQMKNCESIKLSKFTTLISCHNIDYIIKYKTQDDEEKDNIKKIIAITTNDQKIIIEESK